MDIEYLLWLQNLRELSGDLFTPLMKWASNSLPDLLMFAVIFVYWLIDKRKGISVLLAFGMSYFLSVVLKMTFCVHRPFIRDSRIMPSGSKPKSYSFPSGHSVEASSLGGGLAWISRRKSLCLSCIFVILVLLVGFSRNYLGVHTPQDVLTGFVIGVLSLWFSSIVFSKPEHENIMFGLILAVTALCLYYLCVKSYPEDIKEALLRDEISKAFNDTGIIAGLIFGRLIERKYINFQTEGFSIKGVIIAVIGLSIYSYFDSTLSKPFARFLSSYVTIRGGKFICSFLMMFFVAALWPIVIKITGKMSRSKL